MTAVETIRTVRMFLDDTRDWFPNMTKPLGHPLYQGYDTADQQHFEVHDDIINAINEAQLKVVQKYYALGEERALRPLYVESDFCLNSSVTTLLNKTVNWYNKDTQTAKISTVPDDVIISSNELIKVLYPRFCRVFCGDNLATNTNDENERTWSKDAIYIEPHLWANYSNVGFADDQRFPRDAVYTIVSYPRYSSSPIANYDEYEFIYRLHFYPPPYQRLGTQNVCTAKLWYIRVPKLFHYDVTNTDNNVPLSLPREYHPEICALAAELLNDLDVGEMEKGDIAVANLGQRVDLENIGAI